MLIVDNDMSSDISYNTTQSIVSIKCVGCVKYSMNVLI